MRMFNYFDTTTVIGALVAKIESEIEASSDKTQDCLQNFFQAYSVSQLLSCTGCLKEEWVSCITK